MTTCRRNVTDNVCVNNGFLFERMIILKTIKCHFKWSYEKQNLTLVVISYEIYESRITATSYDNTIFGASLLLKFFSFICGFDEFHFQICYYFFINNIAYKKTSIKQEQHGSSNIIITPGKHGVLFLPGN